ncbi:MAG: hypothetical protein K8R21_09405 [Leptospira sp.]|nr:hypothetical protein [Leptospira sp.]
MIVVTGETNCIKGISNSESEISQYRKFIVCKSCHNIITSPLEVIVVDGKHRHLFVNPSGVLFEISCFSSAQGCKDISEPTTEFSWFPSFEWSIAVCNSCSIHLGWNYISKESGFYGLIRDRLVEIAVDQIH